MITRRRRTAVALVPIMAAGFLWIAPASATVSHRNPPLLLNAGTSSKPLRIISIVPNGYAQAANLVRFGGAIGRSLWLQALEAAYPPPNGVVPPLYSVIKVNDSSSLTTHSSTVGAVQDYVYDKLTSLHYASLPDRQTIVVLYIPCKSPHGIDSFGCTSHHPRIDPSRAHAGSGHSESDLFTSGDAMAVAFASSTTEALDSATKTVSHELAEAYTDTNGVGQWRYHTAHANAPYVDSVPWVRKTGTIEMADMGAGTNWVERDARNGMQFLYERILSVSAAVAGGDPDVPAGVEPYYNLSTAHDWRHAHGAKTVKITVTAWATKSVGTWKVSASHNLTGGSGCSFSLPTAVKNNGVHNGETFTLTVKARSAITNPPAWCTIKLTSTKNFHVTGADDYHLWDTGVVFDS
jgi:hypothetical protein